MRGKIKKAETCRPIVRFRMKKRVLALMMVFAMVLIHSLPVLNPTIQVSAATNPYPWWNDEAHTERSCTSFAWQCVYDRLGIALPAWSDGVTWFAGAQSAQIATGNIPKVGSVAVWDGGVWNSNAGRYYGHVAYVTKVTNNSTFTVDEGGRSDGAQGIVYGYEMKNHPVGSIRPYTNNQTLLGFIYPGEIAGGNYTITFDSVGGSWTNVTKEVTYNKPSYWAVGFPTKPGCKFRGWYDIELNPIYDENGYAVPGKYWTLSGTGDNPKECNWIYPGNVTAYAWWGNTITFDSVGGSCNIVTKDVLLNLPENWAVSIPTKDGAKFLGWYDGNRNPIYDSKGHAVPGKYWRENEQHTECLWIYSADVTAYAWWGYTINFDSQGGSWNNESRQVILNAPEYWAVGYPTKNGAEFLGWYDKDGNEIYNSKGRAVPGKYWALSGSTEYSDECNWIYEGNVIAYAKWKDTSHTHKYGDWNVTKEETCTEAGSKDRLCVDCGYKDTEVIPAKGHSWKEEYTVDTPATCTREGSESIHCSVCEAIKEGSARTLGKISHRYGDWNVTKEATCTEDGSKEKVCTSCGNKVTEVIKAKGHSWKTEPTVDKIATCKEEGSQSIHCSECGEKDDTTVEVIPKTDHKWGAPTYSWSNDNKEVTATLVCKYDSTHRETETINTTSEVTKAATYTAKGQTTYTAVFMNDAFSTQRKVVANIPQLAKKANTLTVKPIAVTVKYAKVKKKAQIVKRAKAISVSKPQGIVKYKLSSVIKAKFKKYFNVNAKTGNITIKKGLKKGTYKIKIIVTAAGTTAYKAGSKTVTTSIKVK